MDGIDTHARTRLAVLCRSAPASTGTDGATITAVTRARHRNVLNRSDAAFGRVEDEQTTLGEGPGLDAFRDGSPVFAVDLHERSARDRWPVFAQRAVEFGVRAAFAFPLRIGVINVGVLSLYAHEPMVLADEDISRALRLATAASYAMLGLITDPEPDGAASDGVASPDGAVFDADEDALHRPEVHQASGMVMIQLGVPIDQALARLRAYSFAEDAPLWEVAREVVAGRLRLHDDDTEDGRQ